MANRIDTFQAAPVAAGVPSGWTERWNSPSGGWAIVDLSGDHLLQATPTTTVAYGLSHDASSSDGNSDQVELLCRARANNLGVSPIFGLVARGAGTSTASANSYTARMYSTTQIRLYKTASGSSSLVDDDASGFTLASNVFTYLRFRVSGTTSTLLQARAWQGVEADDPGTWTVSYTDTSSPYTSGYVGVYIASGGLTVGFGEVAIATNGDVATFASANNNGAAAAYFAQL